MRRRRSYRAAKLYVSLAFAFAVWGGHGELTAAALLAAGGIRFFEVYERRQEESARRLDDFFASLEVVRIPVRPLEAGFDPLACAAAALAPLRPVGRTPGHGNARQRPQDGPQRPNLRPVTPPLLCSTCGLCLWQCDGHPAPSPAVPDRYPTDGAQFQQSECVARRTYYLPDGRICEEVTTRHYRLAGADVGGAHG